jgi:hypothetical protein
VGRASHRRDSRLANGKPNLKGPAPRTRDGHPDFSGVRLTDGLPHMMKFVQVPRLLVTLDEWNAMYRQIYTDGRALPDDPTPAWNGYSSGKWVGDTLVVQTIGFRDDLWLDLAGRFLTSAAKVTEEFRRPDFEHLEIKETVDDSKAYTKPWTVTLRQALVVDTDLVDEVCLENEKSSQRLK